MKFGKDIKKDFLHKFARKIWAQIFVLLGETKGSKTVFRQNLIYSLKDILNINKH